MYFASGVYEGLNSALIILKLSHSVLLRAKKPEKLSFRLAATIIQRLFITFLVFPRISELL